MANQFPQDPNKRDLTSERGMRLSTILELSLAFIAAIAANVFAAGNLTTDSQQYAVYIFGFLASLLALVLVILKKANSDKEKTVVVSFAQNEESDARKYGKWVKDSAYSTQFQIKLLERENEWENKLLETFANADYILFYFSEITLLEGMLSGFFSRPATGNQPQQDEYLKLLPIYVGEAEISQEVSEKFGEGVFTQELVETNEFQDLLLQNSAKSLSEFGNKILKWGQGSSEALKRAYDPSLAQDIVGYGVSLAIAKAWLEFYKDIKTRHPLNPSASGRIELMKRIIEILENQES